jgi:hypothetical protein
MGECLPSMCKALGSIPQIKFKKMMKGTNGINATSAIS